MFYFLPLEDLNERYTIQMRKWICEDLEKNNIDYQIVEGDPLTTVTKGYQFLNWSSRVYYATSQIQRVAKLFSQSRIVSNDVFFIPDIWHPGVEAIRYMSDLSGIKVKIYGIQHAGAFDKTDMVNSLMPWAGYIEKSWYSMMDKVFVGSDHMKTIIFNGCQEMGLEFPINIFVTGQVWKPKQIQKSEHKAKEPIVIWPHRLSVEKNVEQFYEFVEELAPQYPQVRWIITSGRQGQKYTPLHPSVEFMTLSKEDYYDLLQRSMLLVSTAFHENFGYTIHEATALKTPVLAPNRANYPEMIQSPENIYVDNEDFFMRFKLAMEGKLPVATLKETHGFNAMLKEMDLI